MDRDTLEVELRNKGQDWQLEFRPGDPEVVDLGRAISAKDLLDPDLERLVAPPPASPLHPLSQEAVTIAIDPREFELFIPEWEPVLPARRPDNHLLTKAVSPRLKTSTKRPSKVSMVPDAVKSAVETRPLTR